MPTFADSVIHFNKTIQFKSKLPSGVRVMNPFRENPEVPAIVERFYRKFYDDSRTRKLILGINPGRLGAGATGIPFTDSRRLAGKCGIEVKSVRTHEPSSVFVYDLIDRFGGVNKFYTSFYITSVCPLGFIRKSARGNWVNCNYYDSGELFDCVKPLIRSNLRKQIEFGIDTARVFVLGKKNAQYVQELNQSDKYFGEVAALEHPRYIEQYRSASREKYIADYVRELRK